MSPTPKISTLLAATTILSLATCGCTRTQDSAGDKSVAIMLNWFPDAQHGGFYAAAEHGHFESQGLPNVAIVPGGPGSPVIQNVALGKSEYGVANADQILLARAQGAPVVAVLAVMQTSPRCIMVHPESGIDTLEKLENVKLAVGAGKAFAKYMQQQLPLTNVTLVNYTGSVAPFLADKELAQQAYVFSEPRVVEQNGMTVRTLMVSELGFDPYNTCLFTREDVIAEKSEEVQRVVTAVRRGWLDYFAMPDKSHAKIVADNPQMSLASLEFGVSALQPLCLPTGMSPNAFGRMTPARWQALQRQLIEIELLSEPDDVSKAYTNDYVPDSDTWQASPAD